MAVAGVLATALTDHSARTYGLWLDGLDLLEEPAATKRYGVDVGSISLTVTGAGGASRLSFDIDDPLKLITVTDGQAVRYHDLVNDRPLFVGRLESYAIKPDFGMQGRTISVVCVGAEALLDWLVTTVSLTLRGMALPDMIQSIVANAPGGGELRALVDRVNYQGSQDATIGHMDAVTPAAAELLADRVDVEAGTAPWVAGGITGLGSAAVLAAAAGDAPPGGGANSVEIQSSGAAPDQMAYVPLPGTFLAGVAYNVTFWIRVSAGSSPAFREQWVFGSQVTTTERTRVTGQGLSSAWVKKSVTWTPSVNITDAVLAIATDGTATWTVRVDLVQVFISGGVTIAPGTTVREAILAAAASCVGPVFLGLNLTVDAMLGLRAWAVLAAPVPPADVAAALVVDSGGTNHAMDLSYDVDAAGIVRAVLVVGTTPPLTLVVDGTGKAGRVAVLNDTTVLSAEQAIAKGTAYLNDFRAGLRGSLGLEDVPSGPTAAIDVMRLVTLTDPASGGSGTYAISSLTFRFYGTKRDVVVAFGGLPPSAAALMRRLTRDQLS